MLESVKISEDPAYIWQITGWLWHLFQGLTHLVHLNLSNLLSWPSHFFVFHGQVEVGRAKALERLPAFNLKRSLVNRRQVDLGPIPFHKRQDSWLSRLYCCSLPIPWLLLLLIDYAVDRAIRQFPNLWWLRGLARTWQDCFAANSACFEDLWILSDHRLLSLLHGLNKWLGFKRRWWPIDFSWQHHFADHLL